MDIRTDDYRPLIHFTAPRWWINDPNGLVYSNGRYHLFYQHHPHSNVWGPMHWGHAVSADMIHWRDRPIALHPDRELGVAFSGSAVIDSYNSSGLFPGVAADAPGLVAIYTNVRTVDGGDVQEQSIAYSGDDGETWRYYEHNPVIANPGIPDFRDPKVLWHEQSSSWVLVLVAGMEVRFYRSDNLAGNYAVALAVTDGATGRACGSAPILCGCRLPMKMRCRTGRPR